MWLLTIRAIPKPATEAAQKFGGAYINCWIDFKLQDGAEALAKLYIDEDGWLIEAVEEGSWIEKQDLEDDDKSTQYYLEAEKDGVCFVYNQWPINGEDDE